MTIIVANTALTNTHYYLKDRVNELANAMSNYVVTTNSNTATGNAAISGTFTALALSIGNSTVNNSVNSTSYSGTSNNTLFVGSVAAANVVSNAQLIANLATYQTTAGLAANVAVISSNNALFLGGLAAANYANTSAPTFTTSVKIGNSTVNTTFLSSTWSFANSTSNLSINIPSSAQVSNGQYFLNANGVWSVVATSAFGGSNTQIIFNDSGVSNGVSSFTFDKSSKIFSLGNTSSYSSNGVTSGASQVVVDSFLIASYRSAEYLISIKDTTANNYQLSKILLIHDGGNTYMTEFGTVLSNTTVGVFDSSINSTAVALQFTPISATTNININRTTISV